MMSHFYTNPMWMCKEYPFDQRINFGQKTILITQPSDEVTQIVKSAFQEDLCGAPFHVANELEEIHSKLRKNLPYLGLRNWEAYLNLPEQEKEQKKYSHFRRSQKPRTLCEMTSTWDMECIEQVLAIKEAQLPQWDVYRIRGKKRDTVRRHVALAYPLNETHLMIIDPSEGPAREFRDGDSYVMPKERFEHMFVRTDYSTRINSSTGA